MNSPSLHGHEVLHWIETQPPMPRQQLEEAAISHFGSHAVFHTCSLEGLSLPNLFEFFYARNKIRDDGQVTRLVANNACGGH